ncbi:MAG: hypothetical protein ACM3SW_02040 [Actinomycetota bacterium]
MTDRRNVFRFSAGLLASAGVFTIVNYRNFTRPHDCWDCFFPYGLPFTIYHEGGYAGGGGFVWAGLAGDLLLVVVVGMVLGWTWKKIAEHRSKM